MNPPRTYLTEIDLLTLGFRAKCPCEGYKYATVHIQLLATSYGTGVLTIKGTTDETDWETFGEPTITANGLYGPLHVGGFINVCVEVTTVASATARCIVVWRCWGDAG